MSLILGMRTDKPEAELYLYDEDRRLAELRWQAHGQLAETIHRKIEELLKSQKKTMGDVQKLVVYLGPGSFTGLRIGVSVANALSYGLNIPIVGAVGVEWLENCLSEPGSKTPLAPQYGAEPHITQQKK